MSTHPGRRASAGLVSGFLTVTAFLVLLAALALGVGPTPGG